MAEYQSHYPRNGCIVSLDDPKTLRRYIVEGTIWRLPPQFWQTAIDAVGKGIVTRDELLDHAPADIRDRL